MANASNANVATKGSGSTGGNIFSVIMIIACIGVGILIWQFIMGNPSNFENGDPNGHPISGNYLGMVYKGGKIVPVLMGLMLMVIGF